MKLLEKLLGALQRLPLVGGWLRWRFVRFGAVGASGAVVNLAVLYVAYDHLLAFVEPASRRLDLALAAAILCATASNFFWNRIWTWGDRRLRVRKNVIVQFVQYGLGCWFAITLQVVFTKILAWWIHYLAANLTAIVVAGVVNFLVHDFWTFGRLGLLGLRRPPAASAAPLAGETAESERETPLARH